MQSILGLEQSILESLRQLTPEQQQQQQQQVLEFMESLQQNSPLQASRPSLREIAAMPTAQRHALLAQYVPAMAQDFLTDPELTEFSVLDVEDLDCDHG